MEIALGLGYVFFFVFLILKLGFFEIGIQRKYLAGIFLLKILCGTLLYYIYTVHYPKREEADIFKFFDDSKILFDAILINPSHYFQLLTGIYFNPEELTVYLAKMKWWYMKIYAEQYNESRVMIRLNAFFRLFSLGYFHIHTVFICFLSFCGLTALYKYVSRFRVNRVLLFASIFCVPTVLFWGSGLLKEAFVIFALGYFIYFYLKIMSAPRVKDFFWFFAFALLLAVSKLYVLLCFLPGIISLLLLKKNKNKKAFLIFFLVNIFFFLLLFNLKWIWPQLDVVHILCFKRGEYIYLAERINTASLITHNYLDFNLLSILKESPKALFAVLFRPHILETHSMLMLLSALENLLLMFLFIWIIFSGSLKKWKDPFVFFCWNFVLLLFILIGITTPVLGSIVRYKVPGLIFLLISFVILMKTKGEEKKVP